MANFWNKAGNTYKMLKGKTNRAIEVGKLQIEISQLKSHVNSLYRQIGKLIFELSEEGTTEVSLTEERIAKKITEIKEKKARIEELEEEKDKDI
ncbi:hypothetical protein AAG747_01020 [Rapidithrix thailandica]|uniref:Uncharacterized protein n=1 Tax=Rapidithrix thailandica TaxID=413964 RepID=A0AAW9RSB3_9BACT